MPKTIETGQVTDSEFKHKVLNLETGVTKAWAIQEMLQMINRDRSEEWSDYDADDYVEGWVEWVEGDFYALRITPDDLANMAVSARIDGLIKSATVSKAPSGKYFVSLLVG